MKTLVLKIEKEIIQITQVERTQNELILSKSQTIDLPDYLGDDIKSKGSQLGEFISSCLENGKFQTKDVALLFDNNLGFFKEYMVRKSDKETSDKVFHIEEDLIMKEEGKRVISQRLDYPSPIQKMGRAAIYGIDDNFLRELVGALKKSGINTVYATSSLTQYLITMEEAIKLINISAEEVDTIIGFDIGDDSYRAVIIKDGKPSHLEEFALSKDAGPEEKNLIDILTDLLKEYGSPDKEKTKVIISGSGNINSLSKKLKSYSGIRCDSIMTYYDDVRDAFELTEDMGEDDDKFAQFFSICGIDTKKYENENYLYGGWSKRKFSRATTKLTIAVAALLLILFMILPIYNVYMVQKNETLNEEIGKEKYGEKLSLLNSYRDVLSQLKTYKDDEASIDNITVVYSDVLSKLREDLLKEATINDMFYDEESGLIIDFDITDIKSYEKARDKLNDEKELFIVESSSVNVEGSKAKNYQIKVKIIK